MLATLTVTIDIVSVEIQSKTFQDLKLFFCPTIVSSLATLAIIEKNAVSIS